ncbi:FAD/NAD(P)-binding oxidoreductase [Clostridiales bacterium COT073_COT-073]|nr:FAD/NAD(P)-binding oxidoreductase [Clostridiales bacterium COT073_COT-073]
MKTDVLIIGGGVVGCAIARNLSQYNLDTSIVEKDNDICMGTSKANSSMIHSGYNINGSTLKGKLCLKADVKRYDRMCNELNVEYKHTGSIFAGFNEEHLKIIKAEVENAKKNGLEGVRILNHEEVMKFEPNINPEVKYALFDPNTGTINPFEYTLALAENAVMNGVKVYLNAEVLNIIVKDKKIESVYTTIGSFQPKIIINSAGLYSDKIAEMVDEIDFYVHPRRGEYYVYDKKWRDFVNHCIYSPPTSVSKGMIIVPTVDGNILCGSNAQEIPDKTDFSTTKEYLDYIYRENIHMMFPGLPRMGDVVTTFAGLRAASNTEDFIIDYAKNTPTMINLVGIQSPGLTSAPAIADMVEEMILNIAEFSGIKMTKKKEWNPIRPVRPNLGKMSNDEKTKIIAENPDYAKIICRCETISKGEILDAIHAPIPAMDVDAIKRRTRSGMGRCQGGFCGPRIIAILHEELGIDPLDITKRGGRSNILLSKSKNLSLFEREGNNEKIRL